MLHKSTTLESFTLTFTLKVHALKVNIPFLHIFLKLILAVTTADAPRTLKTNAQMPG